MVLIGSQKFFEEKLQQVIGIQTRLAKAGINDPGQVEYHCARAFLHGLFGDAWFQKHIAMHSKPDPWMLNGDDEFLGNFPDFKGQRVTHYTRTVRLADALFTVLSQASEQETYIKSRFDKETIKAPFLEIQVASLLVMHGYAVVVREEINQRGSDFDLEITKENEKISVEVTGKAENSLTPNTLINTLNKKRNQVPDSQPAVLYIHVPADWMSTPENMNVFEKVFKSSTSNLKRYHVCVLACEEVFEHNEGGSQVFSLQSVINRKARLLVNEPQVFGRVPMHADEECLARSYLGSVRKAHGNHRAI